MLTLALLLIATLTSAEAATTVLPLPPTRGEVTVPWPYNNTLLPGQSLVPLGTLASATSRLVVQADGNVVLSRNRDGAVLWATNTTGKCVKELSLLTNGNFLLTACDGSTLWESNTTGLAVAIGVLQDDCNFVLYQEAPVTNSVWGTGTQMCLQVHIVAHLRPPCDVDCRSIR